MQPDPVDSTLVQDNKIKEYMTQLGRNAKAASAIVSGAATEQKNTALHNIAESIERNSETILAANARDMAAARRNNLANALLDRLELDRTRVFDIAEGCRQVAALHDPAGDMSEFKERPSGLRIGKMRVPLGVIGIIYESRPNVTVDAAILCLKSGNAAILRGGSEAIRTNLALAECLTEGLEKAGLDSHCIQVVETTDREAVGELITLSEYVDIIVPRGGKSLVELINDTATVPVIKHLEGLCHVYIDDDADIDKAVAVAYNAKARRYGICGAMETLLIAGCIAEKILPPLCDQYRRKGIELRGCEQSLRIVPEMTAASETDWSTEYLDGILSIRIVDGIDQAIRHIETYGSHHTDAIVTENPDHQQQFLKQVDSSSVMINASTQFADGFEYGLGAEIGISTDKLHVRGPVGLEGLTSQKYIVIGDGTIRD